MLYTLSCKDSTQRDLTDLQRESQCHQAHLDFKRILHDILTWRCSLGVINDTKPSQTSSASPQSAKVNLFHRTAKYGLKIYSLWYSSFSYWVCHTISERCIKQTFITDLIIYYEFVTESLDRDYPKLTVIVYKQLKIIWGNERIQKRQGTVEIVQIKLVCARVKFQKLLRAVGCAHGLQVWASVQKWTIAWPRCSFHKVRRWSMHEPRNYFN